MLAIQFMVSSKSVVSYEFLCGVDSHTLLTGDEADQHLKEESSTDLMITSPLAHDDLAVTVTADILQPEVTERPPRREVIWNPLGLSDLPLSDIYHKYNELIFMNDAVQLPRRFGANLTKYQHTCNCKGYVREEITLTPDVLQNAVLIYQQPSPNERCGTCGELLWNISEEVNIEMSF